nr:LOW QUALITY PROTEIN: putative uncharacterized protein FLJ44672 [Symphalangus syndactylus]
MACPPIGPRPLLQAQNCFQSASPGPGSPSPPRPPAQLLPHDKHVSAQLLAAFAQRSCLGAASAGLAPASRWPPEARLVPRRGLLRPSFSLLASSPGPELLQVGLPRPSCCLQASSPGPALFSRLRPRAQLPPPNSLLLLGSCPAPGGLRRPEASSGPALQARLFPHLTAAFARPALTSQRPSLATLTPGLPPSRIHRPNSCLTTSTFGPAPAQVLAAFVGPRLPYVSLPGPPSASRPPGETRFLPDIGLSRPSCGLTSASTGHVSTCLAAASARSLLRSSSPGPPLCSPRSGLSRPSSRLPTTFPGHARAGLPTASRSPAQASRWPLCAQLMPHGGLSGPNSCPLRGHLPA